MDDVIGDIEIANRAVCVQSAPMKKTNPYRGSDFEDFLEEEGIAEDVTLAASKRVLEVLEEHGDALTEVRDIEHWAYFPTPEARAAFVEDALKAGFKLRTTIEPHEYSDEFGAIVFHADTPNEELMEKLFAFLSQLAKKSGGTYDGWETQVLA